MRIWRLVAMAAVMIAPLRAFIRSNHTKMWQSVNPSA
jgi:hypothetical protein